MKVFDIILSPFSLSPLSLFILSWFPSWKDVLQLLSVTLIRIKLTNLEHFLISSVFLQWNNRKWLKAVDGWFLLSLTSCHGYSSHFMFWSCSFSVEYCLFLSTHGHRLTWSQFVWLMLIGEMILILKEKILKRLTYLRAWLECPNLSKSLVLRSLANHFNIINITSSVQ